MNATALSAKMRDFCGLFPVMKVAMFDSKKDMEANFFSLMTSKSILLTNFFSYLYHVYTVICFKRKVIKELGYSNGTKYSRMNQVKFVEDGL